MACGRMTLADADVLEYYLRNLSAVRVSRSMTEPVDAVIMYRGGWDNRDSIIQALAAFDFKKAAEANLVPEHTSRALNREFEDKLVFTITKRYASKLLFPCHCVP